MHVRPARSGKYAVRKDSIGETRTKRLESHATEQPALSGYVLSIVEVVEGQAQSNISVTSFVIMTNE